MKSATSYLILFLLFTSSAMSDDVTTLTAPDGTTVVIYRDHYGVPHIRAATEVGVFYGQGYAVAQDRLFQMEVFRRTALGRLSEVALGPPTTDIQVRATTYTDAERVEQFARLRPETRAMFEAYVSGVNAWLDAVAAEPVRYRPREFFAPSLNFGPDDPRPWTINDAVAVGQLLMRRFGQYGGQELNRLMELLANNMVWFNENRPINDPDAPTTIPASVMTKSTPYLTPSKTRNLPDVDPAVVREIAERESRAEAHLAQIGVPPRLGSFGAIVAPSKSASGNVLLLGAPQLTPPMLGQTNITHEVELDAPTLHVAGMTVAGLPGIIVGHTEDAAWTLTSGNSDNTDTFIELLNENGTAYWFDGQFRSFEVIHEPDLGFARLRTVHGPVIHLDAGNRQAFSWKMTFWDRELEMAEAFYDLWKATELSSFESALRRVPMNFNILYAGRDQRIKYYHVGTLLRNTQTLSEHDPRLPRLGDGSQEWGEDPFLDFEELPKASIEVQDYFVNWNNKPAPWWNNGDNIPWSLAFQHERTVRVQRIDDFLQPLSAGTFDDLKNVPEEIEDHGTYQQVVEFTPGFIRNENIVPPGQSGFIGLSGPSPHLSDQWPLHLAWEFKNMVFNEPVLLWPPTKKYHDVAVPAYVDAGDPGTAFIETVWSDEDALRDGAPILLADCQSIQLEADRDGEGNGRVYTLHLAAPDPVGYVGTAALFQVFVPHSASPLQAVALDDGPALTIESGCEPNQMRIAGTPALSQDGRVQLGQNRPNPFNPLTRIHYELPSEGHVVLIVYNALGQEVKRLVDAHQDAGTHEVVFDAAGLSSGIYFYTLRATDSVLSRPMILQK